MRRYAPAVKMAVQCRLKILKQTLKLVKTHMKTWHVLDEEVSKMILLHQTNQ
jgi:hypothetical protein